MQRTKGVLTCGEGTERFFYRPSSSLNIVSLPLSLYLSPSLRLSAIPLVPLKNPKQSVAYSLKKRVFLKIWKAMENGSVNHEMETASTITIKGILSLLMQNVDENNCKRLIPLGMGDPTLYSCFHTTHVAGQAVVEALQSDKFNGYSPTVGLPQTRRFKNFPSFVNYFLCLISEFLQFWYEYLQLHQILLLLLF